MEDFIKIQYKLYLAGAHSIGIEKIKKLADRYLTKKEISELFVEN